MSAEPTFADAADPAPAAPAAPVEQPFAPYRGTPFLFSFKWLLGGTALYGLLLLIAIAANPVEAITPLIGPSLYLTPFFGLPFVMRGFGLPGRTRRIFYFVLLLPIAHMAANNLAWAYAVTNYNPNDPWGQYFRNNLAGAIGGFSGAMLSFALLHLVGLTSRRRAELPTMAVATVTLTAIGAAAMAQGLALTDALVDQARSAERVIPWFEIVHLPWLTALSLFLAWLMRPLPAPRAEAPPYGEAV